MLVLLSMPEPDSPMVVGLLLALLVTVSEPVRVPPVVGVKVTVTAQDAPTAMVPQLLVWLKSPVAETPETVAAVVPVLAIVTVCGVACAPTTVLPKARLPGSVLSTGPGAVPVPERLTVLVTPPAFTVSEPVLLPVAVGLKVTVTAQEPLAAMDDPQLLVCLKSPVTEMPETLAAALVGLETVTVWAALVPPVATEPKLSAVGCAVTPLGGYGGKTGAGQPLHWVGLMPELPPLSVTAKPLPSQL